MLLITSIYAAILGLLAAALTVNVIRFRVQHRIDRGDGGIAVLHQAVRAQGNFVEQAPMMLILLGLTESAGSRPIVLHILGLAILVSRFASAFGLTRSLGMTQGRQIGGGLAVVVLVVGSIVLLLALAGVR